MKFSKEKLFFAMARKQMTGAELAKLAEVRPLTVSRMRNEKEVTPKTAGKIAQALGVDVTDIMKED